MAKHYLCSFKPICLTTLGKLAIERHKHPPFIDGSCRREPDLENMHPSISALCRNDKFAPKLRPGDGVVYIGTKHTYSPARIKGWPLVAVLEVVERFENHDEAAIWYRGKRLPIPRNCMVEDNLPLSLDHTAGPKTWGCTDESKPEEAIDRWDKLYRKRARDNGTFLACRPIYVNLETPHLLDEAMMKEIMGRLPGTQTPPCIQRNQFEHFIRFAKKRPSKFSAL